MPTTCDTCGTSLRNRVRIMAQSGARCVSCNHVANAAITADVDPVGRDWLASSIDEALVEQVAAEQAEMAAQAWLDSL